MEIRPYRPEDEAATVALWQTCGLTKPYNDPAKDIAFCRASAEAELLIGRRDGAIVASAMVGHDGHRGYVYYLAVVPGLQGGGFGRQMMAAAENWLRDRNVPKLNIIIREENAAVQAFYERLGFEVTPRMMMGKFLTSETNDEADNGSET